MAEEQLVAVLRAELTQFRQGMEEAARVAQSSAQRIRTSTDTASQGFASMEKAIGAAKTGLAALGVAIGVGALAKLGKDAVDATLKMQALETSFKVITGSAGAAANALEFVRSTASRLGQDITSTASAFQKFAASARGTALEGETTRRIFTQVAQASRVLGLSIDDTNSVFLALSQIISKGTVQSEELRGQIGERLPGAFQIAARAMGVTTQELGKLLESGKVLAEDLLPRLGNQLEKELGGGAEEASKNAAASFQRLVNEVKLLSIELGKGIIAGLQPAVDFVTRTLASLRESRETAARETAAATGPVPAAIRTDIPAPNLTVPMEFLRGQILQQQDVIRDLRAELANPLLIESEGILGTRRRALEKDLSESQKSVESMTRALENLAKQQDLVRERFAEGGVEIGATPFAKQATDLGKIIEAMRRDLKGIDIEQALFGEKGQEGALEKAKAQLKEIERAAGAIGDALKKTPAALEAQVPGIQNAIKEIQKETAAKRETIAVIEAAQKAEKDRTSAAEQGARDAAREEEQLSNARVDLFAKAQKAEDAQSTQAITNAYELIKARTTELAAQEDFLEAQEDGARRLDQIEARSISQFEARRNRLREEVRQYEEAFGATERSREVLSRGLAAIQEDETKRNKEELGKQNKDYERFARQVTSTLSNQLFDILSGKIESFKDLLGSIKTVFLRVLADMVAAAAISGLFGTGAGILGAVAGTGDGVTGTGGSGAGGVGTAGAALGLTRQVYNLYGAIFGTGAGAGVTATALTGTGLSATAAEIAAGQAALGATAPTALYGTSAGAPAATFGGGASAGAVAGSALAGAGYGVGTGLIASQLLSLAGLHGSGNRTLAGATGGAVAGAYAGTVLFPGVGTAVGAIAGAVIGAIGGYLSGVFGKSPAPPGFTAESRQGVRPTFGLNDSGLVSLLEGFRPPVSGKQLKPEALRLVQDALNETTTAVLDPLVETLREFPKEFQAQAVNQLNALGQSLGDVLGPIKFEGSNFAEQFKNFLETDLPQKVQETFGSFTTLLERIGPIFQTAQQLLSQLQQQEQSILGNIAGVRTAINNAGLSQLAIFKQNRTLLDTLLGQYTTAIPDPQRLIVGQQIAGLVNALGQQGTTLFRGAGDEEGLAGFRWYLNQALNVVEQDARNIFDISKSAVQEQIDLLSGIFTTNQSIGDLTSQVVSRLDQIAALLTPVGSFQTEIGQVKRVPRTGLALVHEGELIGRPVSGGSISITIHAGGGADAQAIGRSTASAVRQTLRELQQSARYRQDRGL